MQIRALEASLLDPTNHRSAEDLEALLSKWGETPTKSAWASADGSAEEHARQAKQDSPSGQVPGKSSEKHHKGGKGVKVGLRYLWNLAHRIG